MLKRIGIQEIFLPKIIPSDPSFRSASIDWSEDENLTIPKADLEVLNAANWYEDPGADAWQIANAHFDLLFFIVQKTSFFKTMVRYFDGAKIWRAYGLPKISYHDLLGWLSRREGPVWSVGETTNLWFGQAYKHLSLNEPSYIAEKSVYLPAGLLDAEIRDDWRGTDKGILFVCPDLAFSDLYQQVYQDFRHTFHDVPYAVAGAQPVAVKDHHLLGYVSKEEHERNMREFAVMYYHGTERNHVHYHPFEAIRSGMPLVFLEGGMLDELGGRGLPGRARNPREARKKIERILAGDRDLIEHIRNSQKRLIAPMTVDYCEPKWRTGIHEVVDRLTARRTPSIGADHKPKRIAVIVPIGYRGGSLRGAKLLARALEMGSRQHKCNAEIVFGHIDDPVCYSAEEFDDLPQTMERRPYTWRTLSYDEAKRACAYAGRKGILNPGTYIVPNDGINQFLDCDIWIIISDRLSLPLLPVRPYILMVYDYLQRYQPVLDDAASQQFISRAHAAEAIFVTTEFTAADARQFAGLPNKKIKKVPLLAPDFGVDERPERQRSSSPPYFIWTTNLAIHKNHVNALEALRTYYEKYEGRLECCVTGVDTDKLLKSDLPHLIRLREIRRSSRALKDNLRLEGELPDLRYRAKLHDAAFLWHPGRIDNGTFSVIEAASLGVPALSSDYPAMREIDHQFSLSLTWADPERPSDMAQKLKLMETTLESLRQRLPSQDVLAEVSIDRLAAQYWRAIAEFM